MTFQNRHQAFSLTELLAITTLLGVIAAIVVPRVYGRMDSAKANACHVHKGDIEIQAELWMSNTGSWPATNLSAVGADVNYFPEGLPTCPVDGTNYTLDTATGLVIGHNH